jgi:DNA-binding NtrC family response regulator
MEHILILEREDAIREVMRLALEADGACRVSSAVTSDDALLVIATDRPDAVIIGTPMPERSEIYLATRALGANIPVLLTTGHPDTMEELRRGGCRFLPKPFRLKALVAETRSLLDEATQRWADLAIHLRRLLQNDPALMNLVSRREVEGYRERATHVPP